MIEYRPEDWPDSNYDDEFIYDSCDHLFVNVGFNHIKMVCKYCDKEEI